MANTGSYRIKVSADVGGAERDALSSPFTVEWPPMITSASITGTCYNSKHQFLGTTMTISWTYTGVIENIKILLLRHTGGTNYGVDRTIKASRSAVTGSYVWTIPSTNFLTGVDKFKLRIEDVSDSLRFYEWGASTFSILPRPTITVATPSISSQWIPNQEASVVWSSQGLVCERRQGQQSFPDTVDISLYKDGSKIKNLKLKAPKNGKYTVTTSQTAGLAQSLKYKVIIINSADGAWRGESGFFEVLAASTPPLTGTMTVNKPFGKNGPCKAGGGTADTCEIGINYAGDDVFDKVKISYTGGDPDTRKVIIAEKCVQNCVAPETKAKYLWKVPKSLSGGTYFVQVESIGLVPVVLVTSDSFTIIPTASMTILEPTGSVDWAKRYYDNKKTGAVQCQKFKDNDKESGTGNNKLLLAYPAGTTTYDPNKWTTPTNDECPPKSGIIRWSMNDFNPDTWTSSTPQSFKVELLAPDGSIAFEFKDFNENTYSKNSNTMSTTMEPFKWEQVGNTGENSGTGQPLRPDLVLPIVFGREVQLPPNAYAPTTKIAPGSGYKIRVTKTDSGEAVDPVLSNPFTILGLAPSIDWTSPASNTKWHESSNVPIRWDSIGAITDVSIRLMVAQQSLKEWMGAKSDGSNTALNQPRTEVQIIASPWLTAPGRNAFDFILPRGTDCDFCFIQIKSLDGKGQWTSPMFSVIVRPIVSVYEPNHGDALLIKKSFAVEWHATKALGMDAAGEDNKVNVKLARSGVDVITLACGSGLPTPKPTFKSPCYWYADPKDLDATKAGTGYYAVVESATEPSKGSLSTLYAIIRDYPGIGNDGGFVAGSFATLEIDQNGGLLIRYGLNFVRQGRQGNSGGFHVHTGTSCQHADSVGGHFYDTTTETTDPWSPTKWSTETNEILLKKTPKTLNEMLGRTVVVHASSGKRIGCGVLRDRPHGLSETFSVETPTTITVKNSANDCQQLEQGRSHEIFWTVEGGDVETVDLTMEKNQEKTDLERLILATSVNNVGWAMITIPFDAVVGTEYVFHARHEEAISVGGGNCVVAVAPAAITADETPIIQITHPSRATVEHGVVLGRKERIVWNFTQPEVATHVSIELMFNGTSSAPPLILQESVANIGSWEWTPSIDLIEGISYVLVITPIDEKKKILGVEGRSEHFALILPTPALSNVVTSSKTNAMTKGSAGADIRWDAVGGTSDRAGDVDLTLLECIVPGDVFCEEKSVIYRIGRSTEIGTFTWKVPFLSPPIAKKSYAIKLSSSLHPATVVTISKSFVMEDFSCDNANQGNTCGDERRLDVISPKIDEKIIRGRSMNIQWSMTGKNEAGTWTEMSVVIMLYTDGSTAHLRLASQVENTGSFRWFVPLNLPERDDYTIRVYLVDQKTFSTDVDGITKLQFRSICPLKSIAASKCESGKFAVESAPVSAPAASNGLTVRVENAQGEDGLTLSQGTRYVVSWETVGDIVTSDASFTMKVSLVSTFTSTEIVVSTVCMGQPTSGTCDWVVSEGETDTGYYPVVGYQLKAELLKVVAGATEQTTVATSVTTNKYRIAAPTSMNVTQPFHDYVLEKGSTYNVMFGYTGVPFDVDVFVFGGDASRRRVVGRSSVALASEEGSCIFPFVYLGKTHHGCIRESASTFFRGEEWCPTIVDTNLNPVKRGVCAPLILIKRVPSNELTLYNADGTVSNTTSSIPVENGFFRWTVSETELPAQASEYHLLLSSSSNRALTHPSPTFTILCASYSIVIHLKAGSANPTIEDVVADVALNLNMPKESIVNVVIHMSTVTFDLSSQVRTTCPIEAYGTLIALWSTSGGTGFLQDMDPEIGPTKTRIDKSDALPGADSIAPPDYALIIAIVVISTTCCLIMIAVGVYVYRHRQHHEKDHVKTVELHENWRALSTVSKRLYYFNPTTGESSWTPPPVCFLFCFVYMSFSSSLPLLFFLFCCCSPYFRSLFIQVEEVEEEVNPYYNQQENELPPGWNKGEHEGEPFYYHDDGETTSWTRPDWIPSGWTPPSHHQRVDTTHVIDAVTSERWIVAEVCFLLLFFFFFECWGCLRMPLTTPLFSFFFFFFFLVLILLSHIETLQADAQQKYYFNEVSGESVWEKPEGMSHYGDGDAMYVKDGSIAVAMDMEHNPMRE